MGRAPRIQFPGAYYHIISRGNEKRNIFSDDRDRKKFLSILKEYSTRFTIIHYCYVLMDNHYHLVLKTPLANLSRFMHALNSAYSSYYNYRHEREGHLLQGRYRAVLVDSENYLLELTRYIHLNPVRAGIVSAPEDYAWSSYQGYIGKGVVHSWIYYGDIYAYFSNDLAEARRNMIVFTGSPIEQPFLDAIKKTAKTSILGDEAFAKMSLAKVSTKEDKPLETTPESIIKAIAHLFKVTVEEITGKGIRNNTARRVAIYMIKRYCPLKNADIGKLFSGMDHNAVSKTYYRFIKELQQNPDMQNKIKELNHWCRTGTLDKIKSLPLVPYLDIGTLV